jgi:hypothetical protein
MKKLSFLLLFSLSLLTSRAQNPWISLYDQATFDLPGRSVIDTLRIPLRLITGIAPNQVTPGTQPAFVRFNSQCRQIYIDAMQVSMPDGPMPVLQVIVNMGLLPESGSYQTVFSFTTKSQPSVQLNVTLNRIAAKLDTVRRAIVHIDGDEIRYDPLLVRETGGQCDINALVLSTFFPAMKDSNPYIRLYPRSLPISAGSRFSIPYSLSPEYAARTCRLPLGTTTGWVEVSVPGLSNTLIVPVDIINKRSKWWIIWVTFFGIVMGALVRTYINSRRLTEESRVKGFQLIQQIRTETKNIHDDSFLHDISAVITGLKDALEGKSKQADLEAEITKATTAYNDKKKTFDADLATATSNAKKLIACMANDKLSSFLVIHLEPVRTAAGQAWEALQRLDLTTAQTELTDAVAATNSLITSYLNRSAALLTQLVTDGFYPAPPFSAGLIKSSKDAAQKIQQQCQAFKSDSPDAAGAADAVHRLCTAQSGLEDLLDYIRGVATTAFGSVYSSGSSEPKMIALRDAFDDWSCQMSKLIADPYQTMPDAPVASLVTAWNAAKPNLPPERGTRGSAAVTPPVMAGGGPINLPSVTYSNLLNTISFGPTSSGMATIEVLAGRSRRNLFWLTVVQVLALSLVLCLFFFKTYGPNFVGTSDELINLFLLGFSIDVTIDGVMKLIGKGQT